MVYIDVRDRKFQLIVVLPIVLAAIFLVLAMSDGADVEFVVALLGIVAALAFVVYLVANFVSEQIRERQEASEAEAEGEAEADPE